MRIFSPVCSAVGSPALPAPPWCSSALPAPPWCSSALPAPPWCSSAPPAYYSTLRLCLLRPGGLQLHQLCLLRPGGHQLHPGFLLCCCSALALCSILALCSVLALYSASSTSSALAPCSTSSASVPCSSPSSWTWPSIPPPVPPLLHLSPGLWSVPVKECLDAPPWGGRGALSQSLVGVPMSYSRGHSSHTLPFILASFSQKPLPRNSLSDSTCLQSGGV